MGGLTFPNCYLDETFCNVDCTVEFPHRGGGLISDKDLNRTRILMMCQPFGHQDLDTNARHLRKTSLKHNWLLMKA